MSSATSRIAKNTLLLYFRMLLSMGVSLYTSRIILNALGIEDYGINNVVGGVVAMFGLLSGSLSSAISRFITFELGKGDIDKLKRIFCTSVNIQIILIGIVVVLMETVGLWFLNNKMVIPENRLSAANWLFQFSVVTFALGLLCVPYNAVIIAHEKMSAFAYISIVDVLFKLIIALIITYNPFDRLVYFGLLIAICGIINRTIYATYSRRHFEEATYRMIFDKELMKEMFGFAGWNFFGSAAVLLREQGGNILLNLFFGPGVNAARGIAMQVKNAVTGFVSNFTTAVNPQITKSYAAGDREQTLKLVFQSTKFSFFIILLIALPILISTPYILELWLKQVPEHTVNFVRLSIIFAMSDTLARPLVTLMLATGDIKRYQIVVGGSNMLVNIPVSLLCLCFGAQPESVFVVAIITSIMTEMIRLFMLKKMVNLSVKYFLSTVYLKSITVAISAAAIPYITKMYLEENLVAFIVISFISVLSAVTMSYWIGCNKTEKIFIKKHVQQVMHKKWLNP